MPFYLIRLSYTAEAWHAMVTDAVERDRHKAVEPLLKRCGGRFPRLIFEGDPGSEPIELPRDKFVAFGESDVITLVYFPDNQHAAAFAMAVAAGGGVKSIMTTPLLTLDEAMQAMAVAGQAFSAYTPPLRRPGQQSGG